jgi:hypothetical protein
MPSVGRGPCPDIQQTDHLGVEIKILLFCFKKLGFNPLQVFWGFGACTVRHSAGGPILPSETTQSELELHCRKNWRNIYFPSDIFELFHEDITTNISEKCSP